MLIKLVGGQKTIKCFKKFVESISRFILINKYISLSIFPYSLERLALYILVTQYINQMKELRSILRFWLEMIYCEFFPSFHSWKQTTKQFLSSKYKCRELLVFSFLVYCAGGRLNKQSSVKQIKYWSNDNRWHCFGLKYSSQILLSGRLSIRDFVSISNFGILGSITM